MPSLIVDLRPRIEAFDFRAQRWTQFTDLQLCHFLASLFFDFFRSVQG
jgi:hypothetical protein